MNILTVKQLKKHCRDKGIKGYSKLNKDQLINLCNITKNESKTQTNIKSLLVIPLEQFVNIIDFTKNSNETQWLLLWKNVLFASNKMLLQNKYVHISTHGHGVNWLHVRIEKIPKYY